MLSGAVYIEMVFQCQVWKDVGGHIEKRHFIGRVVSSSLLRYV